jgi:hypothetical protein
MGSKQTVDVSGHLISTANEGRVLQDPEESNAFVLGDGDGLAAILFGHQSGTASVALAESCGDRWWLVALLTEGSVSYLSVL